MVSLELVHCCACRHFAKVLSWIRKSGRTSSGPRTLAMRPWVSSTHKVMLQRAGCIGSSAVLYALRAPTPVKRLDFHVHDSTATDDAIAKPLYGEPVLGL